MSLEVAEMVADLVEMAVKEDAWDEMPMLVFLAPEDEQSALVLLDNDTEMDTYEMVKSVILGLRSGQFQKPVKNCIGVVLQTEGWALATDKTTGKIDGKDLSTITAELHAAGKRFSDHPAAIETKILNSVDADGSTLFQLNRGETTAKELPTSASGRIPEVMAELWEVVK